MVKFLFIFLSTAVCFGNEMWSVGLRTGFNYTDSNQQCSLPALSRTFVFTAETHGTSLIQAQLKKTQLDNFSEIVTLTPEELGSIQLQEKAGIFWIKKWQVQGRLLDMLFHGGTEQGIDTCFPPEKLATLNPSHFLFDFFVGSSPSQQYSDSNRGVFEGTTESGKPYRIELSLTQDRI